MSAPGRVRAQALELLGVIEAKAKAIEQRAREHLTPLRLVVTPRAPSGDGTRASGRPCRSTSP
jgi:hypothetical protein